MDIIHLIAETALYFIGHAVSYVVIYVAIGFAFYYAWVCYDDGDFTDNHSDSNDYGSVNRRVVGSSLWPVTVVAALLRWFVGFLHLVFRKP